MRSIHSWRWGTALQTCLDGEATSRRADIVRRHLAECPDCASEMELLRRIHRVLARLGDGDGVDPVVTRLRAHGAHLSA